MSPIPYQQLRNTTARNLIRAVIKDGFIRRRQTKGTAHRVYKHPDGRRVVVTYHSSGDTFPLGTLKRMLEREAKWTEDDLKRLKLLK